MRSDKTYLGVDAEGERSAMVCRTFQGEVEVVSVAVR